MRNFKLTLEYDGTNFEGWQIQRGNHRTIQGEIEKALQKIFRLGLTRLSFPNAFVGNPLGFSSTRGMDSRLRGNDRLYIQTQKSYRCRIHLIGSGRTDSGVHALGQVAHFKVDSALDIDEIHRALNANLPEDIVIRKVETVPLTFHAQYSVKSKTYRYTILNRPERCAHLRHFCWHISKSLNLSLIRREAAYLIGRKDFRSFMAANSALADSRNTIRTIKRFSIQKKNDFIHIDIEADGFLYKMVRTIVGTLVQIGQGRLPPGSIKKILCKKNRIYAGVTAKPQGLCLIEAKYKRKYFGKKQ